nr:hypothetical protein [Salmonella enterica]
MGYEARNAFASVYRPL